MSMRIEEYAHVDAGHGEFHQHGDDQLIAVLAGAIELKIAASKPFPEHIVLVAAGEWYVVPAGALHSGRTAERNSRIVFMERE